MRCKKKGYFAGIDVGSRTTKVVVLKDQQPVVSAIQPTGVNVRQTAEDLLNEALHKASITAGAIGGLVGTGYGRVSLSFADKTITELSCHALGANFLNQEIRMVIDIGGQDSKVIHLDENGNMIDFVMNDKCAAGTGKFLEMVANTIELPIESLSDIHFQGENPATINSMCVVFIESEIISLLARGESAANIVSGVNQAFSIRIGNMAKRLGLKKQCVLTGGVAKNRGFANVLGKFLNISFIPFEIDPQLNGALGAAVSAQRLSQ